MIDAVSGHGETKFHLSAAFVSDIHLGSRYCHAERFLQFLLTHQIDDLCLVGDVIDGWRLRQKWRWPPVYHRILQRLLEMSADGTRLYYTPGNHDEFLRHYLRDFGFVELVDELVYETRRGKRLIVLHGDRFDQVESFSPWLSMLGGSAYEWLMWSNYTVNRCRRALSLDDCHFSSCFKRRIKRAVKYISDFERSVASYARMKGCDGIICGHIHAPTLTIEDGVVYCNTGDWVEHCTALIEHQDGTWELKGFLPNRQNVFEVSSDGKDLLQRFGRGTGTRDPCVRDRRHLTASA